MKKIKEWKVGDRVCFWLTGEPFRQKGTIEMLECGLRATVRTNGHTAYSLHPNDLVPLISGAAILEKLPEVPEDKPRIIWLDDQVQFIELTPDIKRRLGR